LANENTFVLVLHTRLKTALEVDINYRFAFNVVEEKPPEEIAEEEEEDEQKNAGNLLDNLFRKTKTTPCLYWLPLSDEQVRFN